MRNIIKKGFLLAATLSFFTGFTALAVLAVFPAAAAVSLSRPLWSLPEASSPVVVAGAGAQARYVLIAGRTVQAIGSAGQKLWEYPLGDLGRASPVILPDGDALIASYDDQLYRFDQMGQLRWQRQLDGDIYASPALLPTGEIAVATAASTLFLLGSGGEVIWRRKLAAASYSSPAVDLAGNIYLGTQSQGAGGKLQAFSRTGTLFWEFAAGRSVFGSPALDAEGNVYFGSADQHIYSVDKAGKLRWSHKTGGFVNASPVISAAGDVVIGSYDGHLYALDKSGQLKWRLNLGAPVAAAAAALWNGGLLVGDLNGVLHHLSGAGEVLGRLELGGRIDTPVTVSEEGRWLVSYDGKMNVYDGKMPLAASDWPAFRVLPSGLGRSLSAEEKSAIFAQRERLVAAASELEAEAGTAATAELLRFHAGRLHICAEALAEALDLGEERRAALVAEAEIEAEACALLPLADLGRHGIKTTIGTDFLQIDWEQKRWRLPVHWLELHRRP